MIASILAIALMGFAVTQEVNSAEVHNVRTTRKAAQMTFDEATMNASILKAMYEQIPSNIFPNEWPYYFTARIQFRGVDISIHGSLAQWIYFFKQQRIYKRTHQQ